MSRLLSQPSHTVSVGHLPGLYCFSVMTLRSNLTSQTFYPSKDAFKFSHLFHNPSNEIRDVSTYLEINTPRYFISMLFETKMLFTKIVAKINQNITNMYNEKTSI